MGMADHNEPERVWDEYDWERFLQQQDQKTERYMELLEKYIDHPDRDQIIAREMGWSHLLDDETDESADDDEEGWTGVSFSLNPANEEEEEAFLDGEEGEEYEDELVDEAEDETESFELHPLYQASFALTVWVDQLFEELDDVQNRPAAVKLATNCAVASAKLAAALSDDDTDEIGMTIAYLKRALKAITSAIDASPIFAREAKLSSRQRKQLHDRLFHVRDGIIVLMGEYRSEWRRRYNR
mgnify:CR=1 FL=1